MIQGPVSNGYTPTGIAINVLARSSLIVAYCGGGGALKKAQKRD